MDWLCEDGGRPWHAEQLGTAVASVHGAVKVHAWDRTGLPPVQPAGEEVSCVRVWVPSGWQAPHAE
jgi:hypothetical protein